MSKCFLISIVGTAIITFRKFSLSIRASVTLTGYVEEQTISKMALLSCFLHCEPFSACRHLYLRRYQKQVSRELFDHTSAMTIAVDINAFMKLSDNSKIPVMTSHGVESLNFFIGVSAKSPVEGATHFFDVNLKCLFLAVSTGTFLIYFAVWGAVNSDFHLQDSLRMCLLTFTSERNAGRGLERDWFIFTSRGNKKMEDSVSIHNIFTKNIWYKYKEQAIDRWKKRGQKTERWAHNGRY